VRRLEPDEAGDAAGLADQRDIGIVERLEEDDFVTGLDQREQRRGQRFGRARCDDYLFRREIEPLVAQIMIGDCLAQLGEAGHRRILIGFFEQCAGTGL
jgi:hypothetical protein